jgi:hypothetical protein
MLASVKRIVTPSTVRGMSNAFRNSSSTGGTTTGGTTSGGTTSGGNRNLLQIPSNATGTTGRPSGQTEPRFTPFEGPKIIPTDPQAPTLAQNLTRLYNAASNMFWGSAPSQTAGAQPGGNENAPSFADRLKSVEQTYKVSPQSPAMCTLDSAQHAKAIAAKLHGVDASQIMSESVRASRVNPKEDVLHVTGPVSLMGGEGSTYVAGREGVGHHSSVMINGKFYDPDDTSKQTKDLVSEEGEGPHPIGKFARPAPDGILEDVDRASMNPEENIFGIRRFRPKRSWMDML